MIKTNWQMNDALWRRRCCLVRTCKASWRWGRKSPESTVVKVFLYSRGVVVNLWGPHCRMLCVVIRSRGPVRWVTIADKIFRSRTHMYVLHHFVKPFRSDHIKQFDNIVPIVSPHLLLLKQVAKQHELSVTETLNKLVRTLQPEIDHKLGVVAFRLIPNIFPM
uniref:Uncharacterized protein n=1 Tax=Cacopsylla melanoneura TaxID=428564 RepID=A0A8D8RRT3_9HEMI